MLLFKPLAEQGDGVGSRHLGNAYPLGELVLSRIFVRYWIDYSKLHGIRNTVLSVISE